MSKVPFNDLYKKQNNKLVRATFKKAFVSSVNVSAFTADVIFAENPNNTVRSIPLASHIDATLINVNDRCRVDIFDETNPSDMVVAYIYGRRLT